MTTFLVSLILSLFMMGDVHLTFILIILSLSFGAFMLQKQNVKTLLLMLDEIDTISIPLVMCGLIIAVVIVVFISMDYDSTRYSTLENPSINCEKLITSSGITHLSHCSDNKEYFNYKIIGEK